MNIKNNYYYKQLETFKKCNIEDISYRAEYVLNNHLGNELYLKDVYKDLIKKAVKGNKQLILGNLIKNTSYAFNDWVIKEI